MPNAISAIGFCICLASANLFSAELKPHRPYTIDRSEVIDIHSAANGKDYELYIQLPSDYENNPTKKYPLLVVTDGYYAFPLLSSINWRMTVRHNEYDEPILVGISYSKGDDINLSRTRDLTPSFAPTETFNTKIAQAESGKANLYVKFLGQEVLPYLVKNYRINPSKKIFAGHSFGGLFGTYMLMTQPQLFDFYLIGSPSFWYDKKVIFNIEADYAKRHKDLPAKVFMATGAYENGPPQPMVEGMFEFEKILKTRHYPSLSIKAIKLVDEGHLSGYPNFITQGLLWAFINKQ